jgi:putative membrane protein
MTRLIALFSPKNPALGQQQYLVPLLVSMHIAGVLGLYHPVSRPLFQLLVPFNLLASAGFLIWLHPHRNPAFWFFVGFSAIVGFLAEVAGVHTQAIFGTYWYGAALGPKLWEVPLMIGVNWFMLSYAAGTIISLLWEGFWWLKALVAAALMVALDILIEPVAIRQDFWYWADGHIPLQNFVGWYWVAVIILAVFFGLRVVRPQEQGYNPLALWLFLLQGMFFAALNLLYWLGGV